MSASAHTMRRRLLDNGLASRSAAKKPLLIKKNIRDRLELCRNHKDYVVEDWCKVIFDEAPFQILASGKMSVHRRKGEQFHESCIVPTVKHPRDHLCVGLLLIQSSWLTLHFAQEHSHKQRLLSKFPRAPDPTIESILLKIPAFSSMMEHRVTRQRLWQ